jgi:two-component system cell cycle response regulator
MSNSYLSSLSILKGPYSINNLGRQRLLPQDEELSQIWDEVEEISEIVKSNVPDVQILSQTLRRAVSCVVRQTLLERELRSMALVDDLTGLHNRRAFSALAAQQFRMASRNNRKVLLFFADIDGLKNINDRFGHREGDVAVSRAACALQRTFRNSDIVARLGGDEFAVIALEALSQSEDGILRRLTTNLRKLHANEPRYELSLTIGSARYDPEDPIPLAELTERADRAMYQKRASARGRTTGRKPGPVNWSQRYDDCQR